MAGAALNVGVTPVELKEIVYQSVAYVGMAKAFDFVHATNEVLTGRGIQLPLEGQSTTSPETRYDKGPAIQKAVFGEMIDQMYEQSPKDQLHIQRFLSANCFSAFRRIEPGRVFDRVADLDGVPDGYRAMNERESIKVMIKF
jgi:4-carboxymuconolactone decarboxylase